MSDVVQGHQVVGGASRRGPPDASVVPPPAVRAAAERSEALIKAAKAARDAAPPANNAPLADNLRPPAEQPPRDPAQGGVVMANFDPADPDPPKDISGGSPASRDSGNTVPPPPAQAQAQAQAQAPGPEDWEHSFRSLQGRYSKVEEEKRRIAQQLNETQRLLASLSPPAPAPGSQGSQQGSGVRFGPPPPPGKRVTDKERTEYGDELLDVVGRRAQEVYEPILSQLTNELNQIKRQVGGVQNTVAFDAHMKMYDDLAREIPNWNEVNNSRQFLDWLDQPDPISGAIRRGLLEAAHASNLGNRVIAIFRGYMQEAGIVTPKVIPSASGNSQSNVAPNDTLTPNARLAQYTSPGKAKAGQTQGPPAKPIFNASDIPVFYRDKAMGKYAGREAEMNAIEAALFEAGRENRIWRG